MIEQITVNGSETANEPTVIPVKKEKTFADLAACLGEIRKLKGVVGYILKDGASAVVDLPEQDKAACYAILSEQIFESSSSMAADIEISNVGDVLVEGTKSKVLCIRVGDSRISIFMDRTAVHGWIIKRITL